VLIHNAGLIHKDCADERKTQAQRNLVANLENCKSHVKAAFRQGECVEHMWVLVKSIDFKAMKIVGKLDNDPRYLTNIKCNDNVQLSFDEVEQVE
jgi:uncharacterized protein YegJ (DUF2314 family)